VEVHVVVAHGGERLDRHVHQPEADRTSPHRAYALLLAALEDRERVAIGTVVNDSPASRANLLTGDIVLRCDDKAIIDRADFQNRLRAKAGQPVTLTIVRNGETLQRVVRLGPMTNAG